jgi:hypothetical protein
VKKHIIFTLLFITSLLLADDKYSIFFTDVRFNQRESKFYFMRWDALRDGEERNLDRYVRGDFSGKYLVKVTKYYRNMIQDELFINNKGVCIKKLTYKNGRLVYELVYNERGFVPYGGAKRNLIKKIVYINNVAVKMVILDGMGNVISSRKLR